MSAPDKAELLDLLYRLEEYFDQRADTRDGYYGPRPNEAAVLLGDVRELLTELDPDDVDGAGAAMALETVSGRERSAEVPAAPAAPAHCEHSPDMHGYLGCMFGWGGYAALGERCHCFVSVEELCR